MTNSERQNVRILYDTILGELNRICVTDDEKELNSMHEYSVKNIHKLVTLISDCKFNCVKPQNIS